MNHDAQCEDELQRKVVSSEYGVTAGDNFQGGLEDLISGN